MIGGTVLHYLYYKGYLILKGLMTASITINNTANEDIEIGDSCVVNSIQL